MLLAFPSSPPAVSIRWVCLALAAVLLTAGCGKKDETEHADVAEEMVPGGSAAGADSAGMERTGTAVSSSEEADPALDQPVLTEPQSSREVATPAASAPRKSVEGFALQLGSFRSPENAKGLAERIGQLGYKPVIEVATLSGTTYHRVFLRGLPDLATAQDLGEKLRAELGVTYLVRRQS